MVEYGKATLRGSAWLSALKTGIQDMENGVLGFVGSASIFAVIDIAARPGIS